MDLDSIISVQSIDGGYTYIFKMDGVLYADQAYYGDEPLHNVPYSNIAALVARKPEILTRP
jgi:hypothetical protein